jgi:hypothetical protein
MEVLTSFGLISIGGGALMAAFVTVALAASDARRFRKAKESRDVKKNGIGDPPLWI